MEGDLTSINPEDVASVSVLKDASSTAVYGARGAFGVILITTKNPEKGTVSINYTGSTTANRRTVIYDNITDSVEWFDWWVTCYNGYYQGQQTLPDNVDSTVPYSEGRRPDGAQHVRLGLLRQFRLVQGVLQTRQLVHGAQPLRLRRNGYGQLLCIRKILRPGRRLQRR